MNKKIVVTGATRGIGRAIAQQFADGGFDLALCGRSQKDLNALGNELQSPGRRLIIQKCDLSKRDELDRFGKTIIKEFGAVDVLVNNAGIFIPGKVISEK